MAYFRSVGVRTCYRGGSNVNPGSRAVAPQWSRFADNMSHLPMKLLRKKIDKRNLKLRQRNLKLQGEMRGDWGQGARLLRGPTPENPCGPEVERPAPLSTCACREG